MHVITLETGSGLRLPSHVCPCEVGSASLVLGGGLDALEMMHDREKALLVEDLSRHF